MSNTIELTEQQEQLVLSIRKTTSVQQLKNELGKAYGAIFKYLGMKRENPVGAVFAAYHNMDMEHLDVEMGVPVAKPLPDKGEIKCGSIPAGKQVSCTFKGPYTQLEPVYAEIAKWMEEKGLTPTGICYEFYLNSPMEVAEGDLMTKVVFPVN